MSGTAKKIHIQYFAILREQRGASEEEVETETVTAGELYQQLQDRHSFSLAKDQLRVAVNEEFKDWDTPLKPGDRIVFIPPVAGG